MTLTRVTSDGITDGSILNADLHNSAAIAGTKISPDFGSQDITTTGGITGASGTISGNLAMGGVISLPDTIQHVNDTDTKIRFSGTNTISLETGGIQAFKVDGDGDFTFGRDYSTNPSNDLHQDYILRGHAVNTGATETEYSKLFFKQSTVAGGSSASIRAYRDGSNHRTGLKFFTHQSQSSGGDGTERLKITHDGTIDIGGNLNVGAGLDVTGDISATGTILNNTTNGSLSLQANGSGAVVIKAPNTSYDATLQLNCSQNTHGVKIAAPPHSAAASYTLTLPSDIQNGKFLTVDSNGVTSWADPQLTASEILTLIKTVDGAGSGLDADTVDGISSTSFLRSDADDTATGQLVFASSGANSVIIGNTSGDNSAKLLIRGATSPYIQFREDNTNKAFIQWHSDGFFRLGNEEDGSQLRLQDDIKFSQNGSTFYSIWHAGNDGASSGLDADLLDGQHGSYYSNYNNLSNKPTIPTNNNQLTNGAGYITSASLSGVSDGGNAASLDGIDSSQFVRSDQNDTIAGQITFSYNDTTGNYAQMYVTGNGDHSGIIINPAASKQAHLRFYNNGNARWQWRVPFQDGAQAAMMLYNWAEGADIFKIEPNGTQKSRHIEPQSDSTFNLGTNSNRWANVYADTLYGDGSNLSGVASFPSGTKMLFVQSSAPTGWTKQTGFDNRALRLVSSGSLGGGGGGSNGFSNVFNNSVSTSGGSVSNHTLTTSQIPSHSHSVPRGDVNWGSGSGNSLWGNNANRQTGSTGGGGSHNHGFSNPTLSLNVSYVDVIYASKD